MPRSSTTNIMAVGRSSEIPEISPLSRTSAKDIHNGSPQYSHRMSESVEQLIRETDAAFQAVGAALADARASTEGWETMELSSVDVDIEPGSAVDEGDEDLRLRSVFSEDASRPLVMKEKRRVMPSTLRKGGRPRIKKKPAAISTNYFPRLSLRDVLSGKAFRLEADELPNRSPARLPVDEAEERTSLDSNASLGLTPTDPFHLEGLTARLEVARANDASLSRSLSSSLATPNPKVIVSPSDTEALEKGTQTALKALKFHPRPSPRRRKSKVKRRPTLSKEQILRPIPELPTPLASPARLPVDGKTVLAPLHTTMCGSSSKEHILLQSTLLTKTSPHFTHGPIRIEKPERDNNLFSPVDDRLDWTAFQMAILGTEDVGGGDWRRDWETEADEREIDEILDWWEGFGFTGVGALQGPPSPPQLFSSSASSYVQDMSGRGPKLPKLRKKRSKSRNARALFSEVASMPTHYGRALPLSQKSSEGSIRRVELDGRPLRRKSPRGRRGSETESLPPSPMIDLEEDGEAKIPMGYNLGHDLGDFLKWEMENVRQCWEC